MSKSKIEMLASDPIPSLLWRYFLPAFMGMIVNALYNIVDRIFIGQYVDSLALAGLSAVFPIMAIIAAVGMMVGVGGGARVSINMGKGDFNRAELVLGNATVLTLINAVLLTTFGLIFTGDILSFFGVGEQTFNYAKDYLDIILMGTVFNIMGYTMCDLIRSEGNARSSMGLLIMSASINIALDYVFVVHFEWGVKGAAYATVISQICLSALALTHFRRKSAVIKLYLKNLRLTRDIVWYIISIGFAPFTMQMASSLIYGLFNVQLVRYGSDAAVGAMGIIISFNMLLLMSIMSISMANQPIVGFNLGAGNYRRVKKSWLLSMASATLVSLMVFALVQLFPEQIIRLFNRDDEELLRIGTQGLRVFLAAAPIIGFQAVTVSYFQSIGKAAQSMILTLSRQVIILMPLIWILPQHFGLDGIWLASPVSDCCAALLSLFFVIREYRKLNFMIRDYDLMTQKS